MDNRQLTPLIEFEKGWNNRADLKNSPGFSIMENVVLTDRGGVATRPGTKIFGTTNTTNGYVTSLYTAKTRGGDNIMLRASDTLLEYYNNLTNSWALLKSGFTTAQVFDFFDHNRGKIAGSIDNNFYTYFCNAIEPYSRWRNEAYGKITTALTGTETAIPVDSTLTDEVFYSGTASSVSTTAITIANTDWADDIWNGAFVVRITNGAQSGEVRAIIDTTTTEITFATITSLSGTPTFELRMFKYPASGTIINGATGTTEAYTAITKDDELTSAGVVNAHAENAPIALIPVAFPSAPRGNILTTLFGQVFLAGNKRFPNTLYRSKIDDASSFAFSATRSAGEGDVLDINEAKPKITDINTYEDKLIVSGESYMEQISFTQDENDLPYRDPLISSSLVGAAGRSSKMRDDLLFANKNKEITSLARVVNQDTRPLSRDIGWAIKRAIKDYDFTSARTYTYKQYSFIACKESTDSDTNDVIIVYDNNRSVWIGKWNLPASTFTELDNTLYMGSSASREVYEMLVEETAQDKGSGDLIGYATKCASGWLNYSKDKVHQQIFDTVCVEGYVKLNTPITFKLFYDWNNQPSTQWTWTPSENAQQILNATSEEVLGVTEQGVTPLGVELIDEDDEITDNKRFIVFFKVQQTPHTYVKIQWETDGVNQYCELTNISANIMPVENIKEDYITDVETTS